MMKFAVIKCWCTFGGAAGGGYRSSRRRRKGEMTNGRTSESVGDKEVWREMQRGVNDGLD